MIRFNRTKEECPALLSAPLWRLIFIIVTLEIVFLKHGKSQVDTSKALIWSTTNLDDRNVLTILYGDPEVYIADITMRRNQTNITSYSRTVLTAEDYSLRFGVLETEYQPSIVYFYSSQRIYFSTEYIGFHNTTGSLGSRYLLIAAMSNQVTGFALDWVSDLLYWSDAGYQRICLIETDTYNLWRSVVDTNITSPQDIVIYPQRSYLFWSDLGTNPKIERLDLTNDQRKVLLSNGILQRPTTLAIDAVNQRLFWLDSDKETIGSMTFDGSNVSFWSLPLFSSISSFVLYKNYIFFGDNAQPAIYIYHVTQRQYLANITASKVRTGIMDMTMWSPERQPPVSSPCTSLKGGCDHFCITVSATSRRCMCAMGFFLASDGSTCVTKPFQTDKFLLMTDERQINTFQIDVETGEVRSLTINKGVFPTAMDFDPIDKYLYWFDSTNKRIMKTALDNSYRGVLLDPFGTEISSLAVDTASRNLYYTDHGAGTIGKISLSTARNTTLLATSGSFPRALVLDISNRLMYWSDCGYSTIERGSITNPTINRLSIVTGLLGCVTAIAIDFQSQVIYWGYDFGRIERAKLDGTMRTTIRVDNPATYSGLALDSRYLYIADSTKRQIQKLDRNTNQVTNLTKILFTKPYALLYYANYSPSTTGGNGMTTTLSITTTTTTNSVSLTTIILASVISGAVVLVVVIVMVGIVLSKKCRSKPSDQRGGVYDTSIPTVYDTINYSSIGNGATRLSSEVVHRNGNSQVQGNPSERRNDPANGPYELNDAYLNPMRRMQLYAELLPQGLQRSSIYAPDTKPSDPPPAYEPKEYRDDYL